MLNALINVVGAVIERNEFVKYFFKGTKEHINNCMNSLCLSD